MSAVNPLSDAQVSNAIRCLAVDTVQKANSGHPGAPMGMAPIANILWSDFLTFDPSAPQWHDRDRFVLSNGHASALQYTMLHLTGYALTLDDLKAFRQLHSKTPGHPERGVTPGVEVTTGPLGQGVGNAVGLAIAERHLAAVFNRPGFDVVHHHTFAFCGDGCLMEGVCQESLSLAGHLGLEKLILIYDNNSITIDGRTELAFTENTEAKMRAMGWHTIVVTNGDDDYAAMRSALKEAVHTPRGKPTMILLHTTIGYGSKLQGTEKVHGSPLGAAEIKRVKQAVFGRDPDKSFYVEPAVYQHFQRSAARGAAARLKWSSMFTEYSKAHPDLAAQYLHYFSGKIDPQVLAKLPMNVKGKSIATRKASENALAVILPLVPNLIGGSADLTHSNLTRPASVKVLDFQRESPQGRMIRFGVREHGMSAILNGIDAHGGLIAFGATFLNFIGYAMGAVRLSALSHHGSIWVATHDSIGLGEDGPTHQPVELVAGLRATPNLQTIRPADQTETSAAWALALESRSTPTILALSRHAVPPIETTSFDGVRRGAYTVEGSDIAKPDVILIGTGTELCIALAAAKLLKAKGTTSVRVVSMPCTTRFDAQPVSYRESVLLPGVPIVSVEAYNSFGWERYSHVHVGVDGWGASAPDTVLFKHYGLTDANVAARATAAITYYKKHGPVPRKVLSAKL